MSEERRACAECGRALPPGTNECPICLLRLGLDAPEQVTESTPGKRRITAPPIAALAPLFPQLEILDLLGEGGMGAVYRARQKKLQRMVALKILSRELSQDPAFAERFLREAQALARLQHPNIVALYDFGEAGGHYFLVMEYADGLNLRQLMRRGELKPSEALAIVPQICDGLQYAHQTGVIHRDIKPENVLVDRHGKVKIADFGLAKILDHGGAHISLTGTGQVMGTPHYMAPEQLNDPGHVDHRADIYSLGVVFYELLTGSLPRGRFELPSRKVDVHVRLDEIVLRALEHEPERRYQHASELKTEVSIAANAKTEVEPFVWTADWSSSLRTFLSFTAVWVLAGFAFNAGPLALAGAGVLFVIVGWIEARHHFGPVRPRTWRSALLAIVAPALLAASFGLFCLAVVNRWERSSPGYVSSPQEPEALLQLGQGAVDEIVAGVGVPVPVATHVFSDVMDWPAIYRVRHVWIVATLLLIGGMAAFAGAAGALRPPWLQLAGVCIPVLLALGAMHGIPRRFANRAELVPIVSTAEVAGDPATVSDRLYRALLEAGCTVDTRYRWAVGQPDSPTFGMHLLSGQPESPFDRWKITWTGPERMFPHLVATLAGPVSGDRTAVTLDAGQASEGDRARWQRLTQDLLARAGP